MNYVFLKYSIDCAHWLPGVPEAHKCGRMHGHRYDIRIEIAGKVDEKTGWIVDYADAKQAFDPIIMALDHQTLNEISGLHNPTCENIVRYLCGALPRDVQFKFWINAIEIQETDRAGAGWRRLPTKEPTNGPE